MVPFWGSFWCLLGNLFLLFLIDRLWDAFGLLLGLFWLLVGCLLVPFGSIWLPFGSLSVSFRTLLASLHSLGDPFAPFGYHLVYLGVTGLVRKTVSHMPPNHLNVVPSPVLSQREGTGLGTDHTFCFVQVCITPVACDKKCELHHKMRTLHRQERDTLVI